MYPTPGILPTANNLGQQPMHAIPGNLAKPTTKAAQDASMEKSYTRVWVGGLPRNTSVENVKEELQRIFSQYGQVSDICVITTARDVMAFIQYGVESDASRAQDEINGTYILGSRVKANNDQVNYAVIRGSAGAPQGPGAIQQEKDAKRKRRRIPREGSVFEVIVVGFPQDITEDELTRIGEQYQSRDIESLQLVSKWTDGDDKKYIVLSINSVLTLRCRRELDGAYFEGGDSNKKDRYRLSAYTLRQYNAKYAR
ncbi:hypothetical protein Pmar_PMAR008932 [Perkinsus marinus ATCC 50983]|uniref:RRM domain-containing protein n=1 Tax=Perkinsus marinus (strain ATCC 50983 / TXsc) TaxID=423536 RepID=C5KAE1_PERM5|nr:hypothetical protein Pmar_PMAR008932 [Perkinsus marinus ATCC 50983]EER18602.1 hypothetical protein Pmar_PMAR008932 [Perkinsus marinus ATCC 50983]|eukprot:XP_002786806.1 hypothetical protein Pmar_PMAR008932 [Perkinsus marinus ATCC 50983]